MNVWHDMDIDRITPGHFSVYITISKGSNKRYEFDKDTGLLKLVQMLYSAACYPVNVGMIPKTLGKDGDPLEVLVVCQEPLEIYTLVDCSPVGTIKVKDKDKVKEMIVALPNVDAATTLGFVEEKQVLRAVYEEIKYFFDIFNGPEENGVWTGGGLDGMRAFEIIESSIKMYLKKYPHRGLDT